MVALSTKKAIEKYFIAQILEIIEGGEVEQYLVKFLKRRSNYFEFPQIEDISLIEKNCIKEVLEPPTINRRNGLVFKITNFKIE